MIGYPIFLVLIDKFKKSKDILTVAGYRPTVTYMIVAHNEEKVIKNKLLNAISLEYPSDRLEILITSDNSTDNTNVIVEQFIREHPSYNIRLYVTKEHKGKTNAQNEAQKTVQSEILVMTDANSILKTDAIVRLVESFSDEKIAYVCGRLSYVNESSSLTANSESTYWNLDLKMRDIESRIYCITAGNGAIYACRNELYYDFLPIECHDSSMPIHYIKNGKVSLFNKEAIAFEKAGEDNRDEFKRKVRMNRNLISEYKRSLEFMNILKYGWFSIFYFGHRTCRYYLWLSHLLFFISSIILALFNNIWGLLLFISQLIVITVVTFQIKYNYQNKFLRLIAYYGMTLFAQYVALWKAITGQSKATWDKAETTR